MDRSGCPTGLGVGRHRFVGPVRPAHPRRTASRLGPCPMRGLPMGRPPSPMRCFHHPFGLGLDHRCASSRHRTHPGDAAPLSPVQPPGRHGLEFGPSTSRPNMETLGCSSTSTSASDSCTPNFSSARSRASSMVLPVSSIHSIAASLGHPPERGSPDRRPRPPDDDVDDRRALPLFGFDVVPVRFDGWPGFGSVEAADPFDADALSDCALALSLCGLGRFFLALASASASVRWPFPLPGTRCTPGPSSP